MILSVCIEFFLKRAEQLVMYFSTCLVFLLFIPLLFIVLFVPQERACMNGLDYGFSGGNGSSRSINRFNRNSVGRVLRPHMMDESGEGGGMSRPSISIP